MAVCQTQLHSSTAVAVGEQQAEQKQSRRRGTAESRVVRESGEERGDEARLVELESEHATYMQQASEGS